MVTRECCRQCSPNAVALLVGVLYRMANMVNLVTSIKYFRETKICPLVAIRFLRIWRYLMKRKISGSPMQDPKKSGGTFAACLGWQGRPSLT